jgi:predicted O-methyltransferase YrrM
VQIVTHPETFVSLEHIGTNGPYQPNYPIRGFLNSHHEYLSNLRDNPLLNLTAPGLLDHAQGQPIEGWLWRADALKLYEMAYFAEGDILELGTYKGLSTCVMAQAILDSGRAARIVSVDIGDHGWRTNAMRTRVLHVIDFRLGDASEHLNNLIAEGRRFGFGFIDHSHTYTDVARVCPRLSSVLRVGSFAQFHDYADGRNGTDPDYGVWQAVRDTLPQEFEFAGIYGCSGLYRFVGS